MITARLQQVTLEIHFYCTSYSNSITTFPKKYEHWMAFIYHECRRCI